MAPLLCFNMKAPEENQKTALDAAQLDNALLQIPSGFGRLLCLAALAKSQSDSDDGQPGTPEWRELCLRHLSVFEEWLALSLQEKLVDIELCAACQDCSTPGLLQAWASPQNQQELLPRWALSPQRDLFSLELDALLRIGSPAPLERAS